MFLILLGVAATTRRREVRCLPLPPAHIFDGSASARSAESSNGGFGFRPDYRTCARPRAGGEDLPRPPPLPTLNSRVGSARIRESDCSRHASRVIRAASIASARRNARPTIVVTASGGRHARRHTTPVCAVLKHFPRFGRTQLRRTCVRLPPTRVCACWRDRRQAQVWDQTTRRLRMAGRAYRHRWRSMEERDAHGKRVDGKSE